MGSKNSAENKENNQNKDLVKDKNNTSGFFIKDTYSSYKGVMESETHVNNKSGKFSKSRSRSSEDTLEANSDLDSIKVDSNLVKTTFWWKEGGNTGYLTGSFVNWNQRFLMTKKDNDLFLQLVIII